MRREPVKFNAGNDLKLENSNEIHEEKLQISTKILKICSIFERYFGKGKDDQQKMKNKYIVQRKFGESKIGYFVERDKKICTKFCRA